MTNRWTIDRRTVLRGTGCALALPWLESMAGAAPSDPEPPRRMVCIMFPYGIAVPKDDDAERDWGWFPRGEGRDYEATKVLEPLAPLREDLTILGGLSHPRCRAMNGHDTGDTWLTANNLQGATYRNTVSLDQHVAGHVGDATRLRSLTVSTDGGIGPRTRSTTLSYTDRGQPIPALSDPRLIFERLFGRDDSSRDDQRRLRNSASILDLVLDESKSLRRRLGQPDRAKLDEYETSVRDVEQRVERSRKWLSTPLPVVDADEIALDADPKGADDYIGAVYDLLFLALRTDVTRIGTFQIGSYGPTLARTFPKVIGLGDWHSLAHGAGKKGGAEKLGKFDQYLAGHLARFLGRLRDAEEGEGRMLDRTLVLYGSSNSRTHQNRNYPLLLAGGRELGLTHGQYLRFDERTPMSNLFVSMSAAMGLEPRRFADSTGPLAGLSKDR